jgi:uncharacterized protein (DUF1810 family)
VTDPFNLQRFIDAQQDTFATALDELRAGAKQSHWMWFIFPQLAGLGRSPTAQFFAIASLDEADAFLAHTILGPRLRHCVSALLEWGGRRSAEQILGEVDAAKLRSCLTLFDCLEPDGLFRRGLNVFYAGRPDTLTLELLNRSA